MNLYWLIVEILRLFSYEVWDVWCASDSQIVPTLLSVGADE